MSSEIEIDDLRRERMMPVLIRVFALNPGVPFSMERIHDRLIHHYGINLDHTTASQRSNFYDRMRRSLESLVETRIISRRVQKTAMRGGRRVVYEQNRNV